MERNDARSRWRAWVGGALLACAALLTGYLAIDHGRAGTGTRLPEAGPEAREALERCLRHKGPAKQTCYQDALSVRLRADGVGPAMTILEELYGLDPDVERDAHVYAHHIGIEAYGLDRSVAETFAECSDMFSSGCYHGVIQAYFDDRGTIDSASMNELCGPYKGDGQSRWILFQCLHGMGHGLTMHHDHHLLRALASCDLLADHWDRQSCYGGAFMENVMAAIAPHHPATELAAAGRSADGTSEGHHHVGDERDTSASAAEREPSGIYPPGSSFKALDREDLHYPCSIVDDRYQRACYHMQTSAMLHLNGGDIDDAARRCEAAPADQRPICFRSLGRDITAHARQDAERVAERCEAAPGGEDRSSCYFGAVKALVDWRSAPEPGLALCREVEGEAYKRSCYEALGEEIATLLAGSAERAEACGNAEPAHVADCRRGARLRPLTGEAESDS